MKFVCLAMAVMAAWRGVRAAEQRIILQEHLRQEWTNELLTFPFSAPEGVCHPDAVTLSGPDGHPVAVQVSGVEFWPGTESVKTAQLSFLAGLAPLARDTYTVRYGHAPQNGDRPATDLKVRVAEDEVEITTGLFGARLLLGAETFAEPVPAAEVPGPVRALRLGLRPVSSEAAGAGSSAGSERRVPLEQWFGGSRMFGPVKLTSYRARLIAAGPVFAGVEFLYTYADGNSVTLTATLTAGDSALLWDATVQKNRPECGWDLLISPGLEPLVFRVKMEFFTRREVFRSAGARVGDVAELPLAEHPAGLITHLTPWEDWWDDYTQTTISLQIGGRDRELQISARDPAVWVKPRSLDPDDNTTKDWQSRQAKFLPLVRGDEGTVFLRVNAASGVRKWSVGEVPLQTAVPVDPPADPSRTAGWHVLPVGHRLNAVKGYVLDWPEDPDRPHPFVYLSRAELETARQRPAEPELVQRLIGIARTIPLERPLSVTGYALGAYLLTGNPEVAAEGQVVERLCRDLGRFGDFDRMRSTMAVATSYDALIDSGLVPEDERRVLRARMAYLAYLIADPANWSVERGYCSGNPNMTVSHVLNLGFLGCVLAGHPQAREWVRPALSMMERWLEEIGPEGEHPESVANYAHVSTAAMLCLAIAARNAGVHDYVNDPRMKALMLYLAKQYTPPDPRSSRDSRGGLAPGLSRLPGAGRGTAGQRLGLPGMMARATCEDDPGFSRGQQWVWKRAGYPTAIPNSMLGGYEYVYMDRDLPAENPGWQSDLFPKYGAVLRHGLGTPDEWYVNFQVTMQDGVRSCNGSFPAVFARGAILSALFSKGWADRDELSVSRVVPARGRGLPEERYARFLHRQEESMASFSALPRQDYAAADIVVTGVHPPLNVGGSGDANPPFDKLMTVRLPEWPPVPAEGEPPVRWRRQVLFVKDDDPSGAGYLLLRDTVRGGQPTIWQFWTLSEKVGTAEEARDREAFLAGKPGDAVVDPRELTGDRFTALGQFGVDLEYYVAGPADTPRYTLRGGTTYNQTERYGVAEYQDLLHLQLPGDGAYFVLLFPRRHAEPVPVFATLGNGMIVRTSGDFGTDYVFLSAEPASETGDGAVFRGTAASVQDRLTGLVLTLNAPGAVAYREHALESDVLPVSLRILPEAWVLELPRRHGGGNLRLRAPGGALRQPVLPGAALIADGSGAWSVTVSADVSRIELAREQASRNHGAP